MTDKPIEKAEKPAPEGVLAEHHRRNLLKLTRIPYDPEYVTPQEILLLVGFCSEYGVDFTQGLEPRAGDLARFCVVRVRTREGMQRVRKPCRFRFEPLVENPAGTFVPDGGILWANQILGELRDAAARALRLAGAK